MKFRAKLRRSGNSLVFAVPKAIAYNMTKGFVYEVEIDMSSATDPKKKSKDQKRLGGSQ